MKLTVRQTIGVTAMAGLACYAVYALAGPQGVGALHEKQTEIHRLEQHNAQLAREVEREREKLKRLEDPAEQELEIRRRLKLLHKGEKEFVTGDPVEVTK